MGTRQGQHLKDWYWEENKGANAFHICNMEGTMQSNLQRRNKAQQWAYTRGAHTIETVHISDSKQKWRIGRTTTHIDWACNFYIKILHLLLILFCLFSLIFLLFSLFSNRVSTKKLCNRLWLMKKRELDSCWLSPKKIWES